MIVTWYAAWWESAATISDMKFTCEARLLLTISLDLRANIVEQHRAKQSKIQQPRNTNSVYNNWTTLFYDRVKTYRNGEHQPHHNRQGLGREG